jgi:hypothetical protein
MAICLIFNNAMFVKEYTQLMHVSPKHLKETCKKNHRIHS